MFRGSPALPVRWAARCLAAALGLMFGPAAFAELPVEQLSMEKLSPVDPYRIYLSDPAMGHMVDGRVHVIDGQSMRYVGMLGAGFAGQATVSQDRQTLFVATTYHSRLQRGMRSDVVEVYRASDLHFLYEIEIPAKRVQGLGMRALLATSFDDRWLFVQNATPATSVTVVDLRERRVATEVPTPGCYGVIPWPNAAHRFSSVCGDGTLVTFDLDGQGAVTSRQATDPFFDPDKDPVFMHYEQVGNELTFISYYGTVYTMDLAGSRPVPLRPWSLIDAAAGRRGWRPGGYQLFAVEPHGTRLYVGMHDRGAEGSHKSPAKEVWTFDLKTHKRVARMPGRAAVAMNVDRSAAPRLFLLSGTDNRILSFGLRDDGTPGKPLAHSEPVGETPVFLGLQ